VRLLTTEQSDLLVLEDVSHNSVVMGLLRERVPKQYYEQVVNKLWRHNSSLYFYNFKKIKRSHRTFVATLFTQKIVSRCMLDSNLFFWWMVGEGSTWERVGGAGKNKTAGKTKASEYGVCMCTEICNFLSLGNPTIPIRQELALFMRGDTSAPKKETATVTLWTPNVSLGNYTTACLILCMRPGGCFSTPSPLCKLYVSLC
jgi:hypothetical protein